MVNLFKLAASVTWEDTAPTTKHQLDCEAAHYVIFYKLPQDSIAQILICVLKGILKI